MGTWLACRVPTTNQLAAYASLSLFPTPCSDTNVGTVKPW